VDITTTEDTMTEQPQFQQPTPPGYGAPAAPLTPEQERSWATLSHVIPLVAMVLSAGTLGFVGSLVIYLMYKDRRTPSTSRSSPGSCCWCRSR
jgi:uncharacterized Tic20 family protein